MKKLVGMILSLAMILSLQMPAFAGSKHQVTALISADQAQNIALEHAGVPADNAAFSKVKLDDNSYEIKFSTSDGKYEYEISSVSGAVLDFDWDIKSEKQKETSEKHKNEAAEVKESLTQAENTALADAGLSRSQIKYINSHISYRNGSPYAYQVEFGLYSDVQYQYTIDLASGNILASHKEKH